MRNKRGISPLISTVLLVSFVIVVSVIVMAWIRQGIETQQDIASEKITTAQACFITKPEIPPASEKGVCYVDNTKFKIMVDNNGDDNILDLTIRVVHSNGDLDIFEKTLTQPLVPFNRVIIEKTLTKGDKTTVKSVEAIPHILEGVCKDSSYVLKAPATGIVAC